MTIESDESMPCLTKCDDCPNAILDYDLVTDKYGCRSRAWYVLSCRLGRNEDECDGNFEEEDDA